MPNIKNVEQLSVYEVALELNRLITDGRNGTIKMADITVHVFSPFPSRVLTLSVFVSIGWNYDAE